MRALVSQFIQRMALAEKEGLLAELEAAIASEPAPAPAPPSCCPRCGCPSFVRKGRDADGAQRWLCRGCARTFSAKTGSLLALSKLEPAAWMVFAGRMADCLPLRETARRCGVSLDETRCRVQGFTAS